nr:PHP domain-containing protein [uncultured Draconibacterium sp.]
MEIKNPYENVDWKNYNRYKANLHTHTTCSDGKLSPQQVVDKYHELGYQILAITDHNEVTYPWDSFSQLSFSSKSQERLQVGIIDSGAVIFEDRNPDKLQMFAIQGNEVSSPHHIGSLFSNYRKGSGEEYQIIEEIGKKNGLVIINHPGRYTSRNPEKYNADWYMRLFQHFDFVTGIEIYNQGDRYPTDRILWDSVLVKTMPERPVWGYSNDDFHEGMENLGRNWNLFILPELNEECIRQAMHNGQFFHIYAPKGHNGPKLPVIESIEVSSKKGIIKINSIGHDSIQWISGGKIVSTGNSIYLSKFTDINGYIRAEIFGQGSVIGTQPFGIVLK